MRHYGTLRYGLTAYSGCHLACNLPLAYAIGPGCDLLTCTTQHSTLIAPQDFENCGCEFVGIVAQYAHGAAFAGMVERSGELNH